MRGSQFALLGLGHCHQLGGGDNVEDRLENGGTWAFFFIGDFFPHVSCQCHE